MNVAQLMEALQDFLDSGIISKEHLVHYGRVDDGPEGAGNIFGIWAPSNADYIVLETETWEPNNITIP